ncbi:adenylate/guanylate cyclase domain-containing protein [Parvularcula sp. ZS-1/3]|uniref:Adenylate/guanylate cyclase domain-containing protein n=1 Tax=Parvularcula mediterranea TaxID=2732508 RepID=A0A7Y3RN50_9PROT|nr:adenylate/guanylate cyclase domain-containing protein [Parvularcula mediterranea]NNU17143.1 adenylate/guanylate cyclase domain-containing protein [Parvularcula mediterranea]
MFEQRQEQRLRLLLVSPSVIIALIAAFAILSASTPGAPVREAIFDIIMRLAPRPVVSELPVATVLIDEESEERLGDWPWPRNAFGALIDSAETAGARSVLLTTSVAGDDPLSPDVIARRWMEIRSGETADRVAALSVLPSTDLVLARAAAGGPVGLGIGEELSPSNADVSWSRVSFEGRPWARIEGADTGVGFIAVPSILGRKTLSAELREAELPIVAALPEDPDGRVRRVAPLYAGRDIVAATPGLGALTIDGEVVSFTPAATAVSNAGAPVSSFRIGGGPLIDLDGRSEFRFWMPQEISVPSVPAWRLLEDPDAWGSALRGRHVFIGAALDEEGLVRTARGTRPSAEVHALLAQQIAVGEAPIRPDWGGFAEAFSAVLIGVLAVLSVIYVPSALAVAVSLTLALLSFLGAFLIFRSTGLLLDPSPGIFAALGGPLAVGATVLTNMVVRDDVVRGAFHGALPQKAMRKLQAHGGTKLLYGVHRDVTVLSCAFQLPSSLIRQFEEDPRDYVLFKASANDRLRRTILEHEGTVDYGEDGRLLGYWNVPLDEPKHIELACACALKMLDDVSAISQQVAGSHHVGPGGSLEELADGRIEIGIASGPCFAGPVGLGGRNRYAALGQPVSFAGRLRARSELYGPAILTDAKVYDALRHHYAFLDLDFVRREYEGQPEMIYGLVGNPFLKASKTFRALADVQRDLLAAWKERDLSTATRQLQKLRGIPGVPQPYVDLFEKRIMNARLQKARRDEDQAEILGP